MPGAVYYLAPASQSNWYGTKVPIVLCLCCVTCVCVCACVVCVVDDEQEPDSTNVAVPINDRDGLKVLQDHRS